MRALLHWCGYDTETLNQLEDELECLICSYALQCLDGKLHNVISLTFGQLKTATSTICSSGLLESSAERRSSLFFSFGIAQFIQILQVGNLVNVHLVFLLGAQHENNKYPLITSHPQIKAASHKG